MAQGPLHGKCQELHGICVQDGIVTTKIDAWASVPVSHPLYCELAVAKMKRGGVEEVVASCVFQA